VRLVVAGEDGSSENIGIVSLREAMNIAADRGLDLVEVSPNADPPVCRVMDYSKFLYERSKKEREARKSQKQIEIKEIRLQMKTNDYHLGFKVKDARRWLADGIKVRVRIRFQGREITYQDLAREQMNGIIADLQDVAIVEQMPIMEGKSMFMVLSTSAGKESKSEKPAAAKEVKEAKEGKDKEAAKPAPKASDAPTEAKPTKTKAPPPASKS
jgi:translation initiation factor IF-3